MKKILLPLAASLLIFISCKKEIHLPEAENAASKPDTRGNITTRVLNNTLNFPWEILWGPDNFIWFTEREGFVKRMNPATGAVIPVAEIEEVASTTDFNGLLGMALHPQFATNPYVYVVYNYFDAEGDYMEKVVRFTYNGTTLISPMTIIDGIVGKIGGDFIHNGSRLMIGPDMKLYVTTGDANLRFTLPQDPNSLNGKTLRVNLDGTIRQSLWQYGLDNRPPQPPGTRLWQRQMV
jgi:glucose/arabinose dehydrogenase